MNFKYPLRILSMIIGIVSMLMCSGCTNIHSSERQNMIEALKAVERRHGWRVVISERGVFYLDLADSRLRPLYPGPRSPSTSAFIGMASLNPNGRKIVFSESVDLNSYSLTIFDLISKTREVHFHLPYLQGPRWSPDGGNIAFEGTTVQTKGDGSLFLYKLGENDFSLLAKEDVKSGDLLFCWAPDGKSIVYQSGDDKIRIVDVETRQTRTIDSGQFPTWSPNGRYISYQSSDAEYSLYEIQTGQKTRLLKVASLRRGMIWSPDSRYVVYSKLSGGLWNWVTGALSVSDSYGDLCVMDVQSKLETLLYRHSGSLYATDWGKIEIPPDSVAALR